MTQTLPPKTAPRKHSGKRRLATKPPRELLAKREATVCLGYAQSEVKETSKKQKTVKLEIEV